MRRAPVGVAIANHAAAIQASPATIGSDGVGRSAPTCSRRWHGGLEHRGKRHAALVPRRHAAASRSAPPKPPTTGGGAIPQHRAHGIPERRRCVARAATRCRHAAARSAEAALRAASDSLAGARPVSARRHHLSEPAQRQRTYQQARSPGAGARRRATPTPPRCSRRSAAAGGIATDVAPNPWSPTDRNDEHAFAAPAAVRATRAQR
jgi:hypothetical protein